MADFLILSWREPINKECHRHKIWKYVDSVRKNYPGSSGIVIARDIDSRNDAYLFDVPFTKLDVEVGIVASGFNGEVHDVAEKYTPDYYCEDKSIAKKKWKGMTLDLLRNSARIQNILRDMPEDDRLDMLYRYVTHMIANACGKDYVGEAYWYQVLAKGSIASVLKLRSLNEESANETRAKRKASAQSSQDGGTGQESNKA